MSSPPIHPVATPPPPRRPHSGVQAVYVAPPEAAAGLQLAAGEEMSGGLLLPDGLTLAEVERRYLQRAVQRAAGNRTEAARSLGIGRNTLLRKLREGDGDGGEGE